ncbi:flagellin [Fontivita pretiosa]|uniref:flagellin N-terminal helical domain-containing protein n=1 Tax=Fontivita pretiosa TaxID=2989684 RepID=UPI003D167791
MSRINTNVSSLIAQRILTRNNNALNTSLERLSTGLKINKGADNPAGLIASENLRAEKAGIVQAIDNAARASNIIGTAEGGLSEVSALLTELQSLVSQSANSGGLSSEEIAANQLQVDSILNTINRIAQSTAFQGKKLLNGNYDYTTSGVNSTSFDNVRINAARVPDGGTINVVVQVTASAQTGQILYSGGTLTDNVTIEVAGNTGTEQLSFSSGTTVSSIAAAINAVTTATGVSATVSGADLVINSTSYGADQFVSIKTVAGTFTPSTTKDYGQDAAVTINGAEAQAKGLSVSFRSSNLDIEFDLDPSFNLPGTDSFVVTGGGATFALGSKVTETDKASIGIASVSTGSLGDNISGYLSALASGGEASLNSDNLVTAQRIIDKAIKQVSQLRGRLGAFQKFTIGSTINALGVAFENVSASESAIRDTDFAEETANLTRSQILAQAATTVLAQANASPQAALSLLRG